MEEEERENYSGVRGMETFYFGSEFYTRPSQLFIVSEGCPTKPWNKKKEEKTFPLIDGDTMVRVAGRPFCTDRNGEGSGLSVQRTSLNRPAVH